MVSTRHHPTEFPEPEFPSSLSPTKRSASSTSSSSTTANGSALSSLTSSASKSPSKRGGRGGDGSSAVGKESATTAAVVVSNTSKAKHAIAATASRIPFAAFVAPRPGYHTPPPLVIWWMLISLPLVTWDFTYMFLRPHSMPGGKYHGPWKPYALYGTVDLNYGFYAYDKGDGFPAAQSAMNVLETACYLWYMWKLVVGLQGTKGSSKIIALLTGKHDGATGCAEALVVMFAASVMTLSKTMLYWLIEFLSTPIFEHIGHNDAWTFFWIFFAPNILWVFLPAYQCWVFGKEIIWALQQDGQKKLE